MRVFYILGTLTLFTCSKETNFEKFVIDPSRQYDILHEDSLYDYYDGPTKISADLFVDGCSSVRQMCEIKFSEAKWDNDTLHVEISETNSIVDYHYMIKIVDGNFNINYWYQTTIDITIREIRTIQQRLILDNSEVKKGEVIRGHTEYIGQCVKGCVDAEMKPIHIVGNFKAIVK